MSNNCTTNYLLLAIIIAMLFSKWDRDVGNENLIKSYNFAAIKHAGQIRKNINNAPYVNHLTDVAELLSNAGVTNTHILIAGVLHDVIEDTDTPIDEIKKMFGDNVLKMILECSHNNSLSKIDQRKHQLNNIVNLSYGAKLIKLADGYSNLHDLLEYPPVSWSVEKVNGYKIFLYARYLKLKSLNPYFDIKYAELARKYNINFKDEIELNSMLNNYYNLL